MRPPTSRNGRSWKSHHHIAGGHPFAERFAAEAERQAALPETPATRRAELDPSPPCAGTCVAAARSFREPVQSAYFGHLISQLESNATRSLSGASTSIPIRTIAPT